MESAGFRSVFSNFTQLNSDEAGELNKLAELHPYSQLIHLLSARRARALSQSDSEERLHLAAVYSTDRGVLKQIMTAPVAPRQEAETKHNFSNESSTEIRIQETSSFATPVPAKESEFRIAKVPEEAASRAATSQPVTTDLSGDALRNDIYTQLEKLKKSKHDFEESVEAFAHQGVNTIKPLPSRVSKEAVDPLLDEIRSTKKKVPVQNPKAQEQNEIIEEFIRKEPVLPKPVGNAAAKDLAEDSSLFSDNIISETLVEILLKQGKKEKAIEVLKKLIWKFPQKKAYFAAQIESLKG